jgi:hypothetical protein
MSPHVKTLAELATILALLAAAAYGGWLGRKHSRAAQDDLADAKDEQYNRGYDTAIRQIPDERVADAWKSGVEFGKARPADHSRRRWWNRAEPVQTCRQCGCTQERGCEVGCWWVTADMCSACVGSLAEAAEPDGPPEPTLADRILRSVEQHLGKRGRISGSEWTDHLRFRECAGCAFTARSYDPYGYPAARRPPPPPRPQERPRQAIAGPPPPPAEPAEEPTRVFARQDPPKFTPVVVYDELAELADRDLAELADRGDVPDGEPVFAAAPVTVPDLPSQPAPGPGDVPSVWLAAMAEPAKGLAPHLMIWDAADGSKWNYYPPDREWQGWVPGEDGTWYWPVARFRATHPEAPPWDGWTLGDPVEPVAAPSPLFDEVAADLAEAADIERAGSDEPARAQTMEEFLAELASWSAERRADGAAVVDRVEASLADWRADAGLPPRPSLVG